MPADPANLDSETKVYTLYELPCREKICLRGFGPGSAQTGLYNNRQWLEA